MKGSSRTEVARLVAYRAYSYNVVNTHYTTQLKANGNVCTAVACHPQPYARTLRVLVK